MSDYISPASLLSSFIVLTANSCHHKRTECHLLCDLIFGYIHTKEMDKEESEEEQQEEKAEEGGETRKKKVHEWRGHHVSAAA